MSPSREEKVDDTGEERGTMGIEVVWCVGVYGESEPRKDSDFM